MKTLIYAWVQRRLGEVADNIGTGRSVFISNVEKSLDSPYAVLGSTSVISYDKEFDHVGDFILTARVGANAGNLYRYSGKVKISDNTVFIQSKNLDFIFFSLFKFDLKSLSFGTGQPLIKASELKNLMLHITNQSEQKTIGNFFRTLDNTIALYKRKLDNLKLLKKAYLQQMFPQEGERVPKVRFAWFTGEWKMRKLGDVSIKVNEKNKSNVYSETLTNSAEHGIISQRDFFDKDISNKKNLDTYFVVLSDDFVYNPRISNFAPVGPIKRNTLGRTGVMSPLYYVFRVVQGDLTFIEKYFESAYWHEFMKMNGDNGVRSDRFNIKDSTLEQMPIPFPALEEQQAIGKFLYILDLFVVNQQSKLDKSLKLKSTYLQKMFV